MSDSSQTSSQVPGEKTHLYWLDWVRFIAALMVVAVHSRGNNWVDWGHLTFGSQTKLAAVFFAVTRTGTEWVLVFFVLSGFLVGGKMLERLARGTFDLRTYVIDRASRVWVPLVPALLWSALVGYWTGKHVSWLDFGGNLLGLQVTLVSSFAENNPLWSMAYEIWFYFLAGCVAVWATTRAGNRVWVCFAVAVGFAIFTKLDSVFLFSWVLGAATYRFYKSPLMPLSAAAGLGFVGAGYISAQLQSATVSVDTSSWARYAPSTAVATILLSLGIALLLPFISHLKPKTKFGGSLDSLGAKLAAFSYTLYLTHYPLLYIWEHYMPRRYVSIDVASINWYLLRVGSCVLFGWLFHLPFERQTSFVRKILHNISTARFSSDRSPSVCQDVESGQ